MKINFRNNTKKFSSTVHQKTSSHNGICGLRTFLESLIYLNQIEYEIRTGQYSFRMDSSQIRTHENSFHSESLWNLVKQRVCPKLLDAGSDGANEWHSHEEVYVPMQVLESTVTLAKFVCLCSLEITRTRQTWKEFFVWCNSALCGMFTKIYQKNCNGIWYLCRMKSVLWL